MKYFSYMPFPERIYFINETLVLINSYFCTSGNTVAHNVYEDMASDSGK
jgi:hypothetical protein